MSLDDKHAGKLKDPSEMTTQEIVDEYGELDTWIKGLSERKAKLDKALSQEFMGSAGMDVGETKSLIGLRYSISARLYAGSKSFPATSVKAAEEAYGIDLQPFAKQNSPSLRKSVSRIGKE